MFAVGASFAADGNVTLGEVDDEVAIDDNVLSVEEDSKALSVDEKGSEVVSASATVTNDTFHNYFDDSGTLLDTVTADELEFEGDFSGVDVNYITIGKSIKFTGNDAVFNDVSFVIMTNDVTIDGFNLTQTSDSLFSIYGDNIVLSNNNINFTTINGANSYAIYAGANLGGAVNNLQIINNNFTFTGTTDGTDINNVICVEGDSSLKIASKNIHVEGNKFDIVMPSIGVNYHTNPYTTYSEGIVFFFCEDVKFVDNRVKMRCNTFNLGMDGYDSMYAVSVKSNTNVYEFDWDDDDEPIKYPIISKNAVISNNTFDIVGHNYTYAVSVSAKTLEIFNNTFNVVSEGYYANAITVAEPSCNGNVSNNYIDVNAVNVTYGIYGFRATLPITDITYEKNIINAESYVACGFEIEESSSILKNNTITANGNYTHGIILSVIGDPDERSIKATVLDNVIYSLGSNVGVIKSTDTLAPESASRGISVKGDVLIKGNNITSTNVGIRIAKHNEATIDIENNKFIVESNSGTINNYAIYTEGEVKQLNINGNAIKYVGLVDYQFVVVDYDYTYGYPNPIYDTSNNTRAYCVYVKNSNVVIRDNDFDIAIPTFAVNWGLTRESFSEGIVLVGCDDLELINNNVTVTTNGGSSWDTVYGIDVLNSANPSIKDNNITLKSIGYLYAIIINDNNFNISGNKIGVVSDNYACGIDVEGPANGLIDKNTISLKATESAYGIYTGMTSGDVNVNITTNAIDAEAYYVVALEIAAKTALIENNNIYANGNHTIGVGTKVSEVTIKDNAINAFASNEGDKSVWDGMGTLNSAIKVIEGNATIYNNTVASNAIGINVDSTNDKVNIEKNIIIVNANSGKVDNYAIVAEEIDDLRIINNDVTYSGLVDYQFVIVDYDYTYGYPNPIYDTSNNTRAYGVYVKNSNVVIRDNDFDIAIPTFAVNWGLTRESFSEGIVLIGCDDLEFINNNVTINTNGGASWDTVYGIDVLNSANPAIKNNNVTLKSTGYLYAIIINDNNFNISGNKIGVVSDNYACGIDVEGPANGLIDKNTISLKATESAYGIYTGMTSGDVNVNITTNAIDAEAYYVVALEIAAKTALIENNNVTANGNHTIGVGTKVSEVTIKDNIINAFASNEGDNYVWDGMGTLNSAIKVIEGNATIYNNTVASNAIGINADSTNDKVNIEKNIIIVNANSGKVDNYAIVAENIEDLTIINNDVTYSGLVDYQFVIVDYDYTYGYPNPIYDTSNNTRAYGVYVKNSNVVIRDNDFDIAIPTFAVNWGATREAFSEGIVLVGCDDLEFANNNVTVTTNGGSIWDTVYGIDVLNSANPAVKNNNITLYGEGYAYGLIINDQNFDISENTIIVTSDNYACGIDVEGTANGNITKNTISATGVDSAYPIYSGMNDMPVSVDIVDNKISGEAYYVVGVEVGGDKVLLENNDISVKGNHTIGVGAYLEEIVINKNNITSDASNVGNVPVWDNFGTDTSGIKIAKGNFTISNNDIETTGDYAVNSGDASGNITNNELLSSNGEGDNSIIGLGDVNITGNPSTHNKYLKVIMFANDLTKVYGSADQFIAKVLDENGQPVYNKTITFVLSTGESFTATTDADGFAKLDIDLVKGEYLITSRFAGDSEYGAKSITSNIVVNAKPTALTAPDASVLLTAVKKGYTYKITLKDNSGNVLANQQVTINGKAFTTDKNGVVTYKVSASKAGTQKLTVKFAGDDKYAASTKTATIKITKEATKLTAKKATFKAKKKSKKYTVTLKDSKGKGIKGVKVTIKVGKKTYSAKTKANGKATFNLKKLSKKGKYTAKITFAGNGLYNNVAKSVKITVKK